MFHFNERNSIHDNINMIIYKKCNICKKNYIFYFNILKYYLIFLNIL